MMDGSWLVFYPEGQLAVKAQYEKGKGKQVGFDQSGYKCMEATYLDNQKHGKEIRYNPDGVVVKVIEYEHGEVVSESDNLQNDVE